MQRPRTPGAGITGAEATITLASRIVDFIIPIGPTTQRLHRDHSVQHAVYESGLRDAFPHVDATDADVPNYLTADCMALLCRRFRLIEVGTIRAREWSSALLIDKVRLVRLQTTDETRHPRLNRRGVTR
jgi:hypothetical protein